MNAFDDNEKPREYTEIEKLVQDAANKIGEHCDSVRIFVTFPSASPGHTASYTYGSGNVYATQGHVQDWLWEQQAKVFAPHVRPCD